MTTDYAHIRILPTTTTPEIAAQVADTLDEHGELGRE